MVYNSKNINTGLVPFCHDLKKKIQNETWTHPPTFIINSDVWKKSYFAKPLRNKPDSKLTYFGADFLKRAMFRPASTDLDRALVVSNFFIKKFAPT